MRIGRSSWLALCLVGLGATGAWAQAPTPTLGPADGSATYQTPSTDQYWRVDDATKNGGTNLNIVYQTIGTTSKYWVAPSIFQHSMLDHTQAAHTTGLAANAKWKWEVDGSTSLGPTAEFEFPSYTQGTERPQTSLDVKAVARKEMILKVTETGDCGDGLSTYFKIIATGEPQIEIESASLVYGTGSTDKIDGTSEVAAAGATPTAIQNAKGFIIKTCDATKINGKTLKIKLKSTEEGVPDDLRRYAFSVQHMAQKHADDGTYTTTTPLAMEKEYKLKGATPDEKKFRIPAAGAELEFTLTNLTLATGEDYAEHVFYLDGSEGRTKLVSMVSHRSIMTDPTNVGTLAAYDFDKTNKGYYVVVRLESFRTGPVYFIPYID